MRRGPLMAILGAGAVLLVVVGVLIFRSNAGPEGGAGPSGSSEGGAGPAGSSEPAEPVTPRPTRDASWALGPFTRVTGKDMRAEVDRYLMLDVRANLPREAEEALRAKLTAFLRAYTGTDFDRFLEFRPVATMCSIDDDRLAAFLAAWPKEFGPVPTDAAGIMRLPWRMCVEEGMGPIKPGAVIDAVKWASFRATIRHFSKREVIAQEWDETLPEAGHLRKENTEGQTERAEGFVTIRPAVPNVISAVELAKRDGGLLFADIELVCRASGGVARRLILRLIWDSANGDWLPIHALVYGGGLDKPFIW